MEARALFAFLVALALTAAVTPLVARLAVRIRAVDPVQERGLAQTQTPLLGGLAILVGVLIAGALFLPASAEMRGILGAAALITAVGIADDIRDLSPAVKLLGQAAAGLICVLSGVHVDNFTFPFLGRVDLGDFGGPLTLLGLVGVMNVVNFSDGVDGLAAGVCAISAIGFAVIAFDLREDAAGVLAGCIAGAALGFLVHNFHPASVFMGDSGSNLLGLLLGGVIVEGSLKTNALIALVVPLVILAVPFLDTGFVVAKRIKYRRPVYQGDSNHFHHRFHRMGFSQRKTVLYLYAWTTTMTGIAVALRFVPYSQHNGHLNAGWAAVMAGMLLVGLAASAYLVYVLEILKLRRLRAWQLRRDDPATSEHQIDSQLEEDLETGEFPALR
ncbi:MAG: UDP-GlcNAc:undecaprenyl-phosphate/decaprenyl-phosphate GlcNAc-phosphate transferase [Solirubrobacteraceae bacterium]|jgi:UDP-GlcNAc:undecaprenyl-phosphate GlcNAc-1-phosphate transferase|nr:UDP-GlcNAc:undecaprenyl-phosphate/decaprenyl-phosphate GlcNAc-phosphate transferase [Solirubrobacteraceae bacterium]